MIENCVINKKEPLYVNNLLRYRKLEFCVIIKKSDNITNDQRKRGVIQEKVRACNPQQGCKEKSKEYYKNYQEML